MKKNADWLPCNFIEKFDKFLRNFFKRDFFSFLFILIHDNAEQKIPLFLYEKLMMVQALLAIRKIQKKRNFTLSKDMICHVHLCV